MRDKARVLTDVEKENILNDLAEGKSLSTVAKAMGMKAFGLSYCVKKDPLFAKEVEEARSFGIDMIYEQLPDLADVYDNPHRARVKMECIAKYAGALKPDKYGDRLAITVKQTADLTLILQNASERVIPLLRDVGIEERPSNLAQDRLVLPDPSQDIPQIEVCVSERCPSNGDQE